MAITSAVAAQVAAPAASGPKAFKERSALTQMLDKSRDDQYNIFMKMFLAQVKNQSIDNPMSTHEMTQSVMSFFQTAEMTQTNKLLKQGNDLKMREHLSVAKSYLNKTVEYEGDLLSLEGTPQTIRFQMPEDVKDPKLMIYTLDNKLVKSFDLPRIPGEGSIQWDGDCEAEPGKPLPAGQYIVGIIAQNDKKEGVTVPTYIKGRVQEVRYDEEGEEFLLMVKNTPVALTDVLSISKSQVDQYADIRQRMDHQIKTYEELNTLLRTKLLGSSQTNPAEVLGQQGGEQLNPDIHQHVVQHIAQQIAQQQTAL